MKFRILTPRDFTDMPWKNGKGTTTEFYRIEREGRLVFRISSAAVDESGLFSDFDGFDRTLLNLGPGTMELIHDGKAGPRLGPRIVGHFDGGARTICNISEPTRDLNIFCARNEFFATTHVWDVRRLEALPVPSSSSVFIYVISGDLSISDGKTIDLRIGTGEVFLRERDPSESLVRFGLRPENEMNAVVAVILFHQSL